MQVDGLPLPQPLAEGGHQPVIAHELRRGLGPPLLHPQRLVGGGGGERHGGAWGGGRGRQSTRRRRGGRPRGRSGCRSVRGRAGHGAARRVR